MGFLELCKEPGRQRAYALITAGRLAITVMDHALARRLLTEALSLATARSSLSPVRLGARRRDDGLSAGSWSPGPLAPFVVGGRRARHDYVEHDIGQGGTVRRGEVEGHRVSARGAPGHDLHLLLAVAGRGNLEAA